jgi:hypothetical protein
MPKHKMSVAKVSLDKMPVDEMSIDEMPWCQNKKIPSPRDFFHSLKCRNVFTSRYGGKKSRFLSSKQFLFPLLFDWFGLIKT